MHFVSAVHACEHTFDLNYNIEAADAIMIAKFIIESVAANPKGTAKDLRSYFNAIPGAVVNIGDLHDSPCNTLR